MVNKLVISLAVVVAMSAASASVSPKASAHVLVANESNTMGAVLHITPDDDPVAGESSDIFFDVQDKRFSTGTYTPRLAIANSDGDEQRVEAEKNGSYVSAQYTFPTRGVYTIKLTLEYQGSIETFSVTQRVSRGVNAASGYDEGVRHQWAEVLLVASVASMAVLFVIFASRVRAIFKLSK